MFKTILINYAPEVNAVRCSLTKRFTCIHSPFYFQAKCVAENSGLAEIETEAENNFLKSVAVKTFLNGRRWVYIT